MHNRDFIWHTKEGKKIKIKDLSSKHLSNIFKYIKDNEKLYREYYGEKQFKRLKFSIEQEIRFRKLNRIKMDNQDNLF